MKSLPRAILCTIGLLFGGCFLFITMPIDREANVVGWEYNTTRNTSRYVLREGNLTAALMPDGFCERQSLLVVVVCSAPANRGARDAIRGTWGAERSPLGYNVSLYFLLGETGNSTAQKDVLLESDRNGDIIQERFIDTYNNLTLKSVVMLKLVSKKCAKTAKYLLKIDDDMFVNVPLLVQTLSERNSSEQVLLGKLICGARPIKDANSKWYAPNYMYNDRRYPNYLSGTGYLMSIDVAEKLFNVALVTPIFYLEDVYLTGICAKRAHIRPRNSAMFTYRTMKHSPCVIRNLITIHHFTPLQMEETHQELNDALLAQKCYEEKQVVPTTHHWLVNNVLKTNKSYRRAKCE